MFDQGTTGTIVNRGGVSLIVELSNNSTATQIVELEVFSVSQSSTPVAKVGAAHQLFSVPARTVITKTFDIAGFPAYEFQATVTSADVVINIFVADVAGNLLPAECVLNSQASPITTLTPLP